MLASVAPSAAVMAAAPPEDAQRLFIESWTVRGNRAELSVRAATSLTVQVRAQAEDGGESFRARDVLYRGERQTYSVPLRESHRAIAISWNDALGNAGLRVLDRRSFPFPVAPLETSDCTVVLEEIGWTEGAGRRPHLRRVRERGGGGRRGRRADRPRRSHEVCRATSSPGRRGRGGDRLGPSRRLRSRDQRGAADGLRARRRDGIRPICASQKRGLRRLSESGPAIDSRDPSARQGRPDPPRGGDLARQRARHRALRRLLPHGHLYPERGVGPRVPHGVHAPERLLRAGHPHPVGDPSGRLGLRNRRRSAAGVSATVGTWLSTTVGSWLSTTVGSWLSAKVGSWLSATVGSWLSATVGSWLSTTVDAWLSTTVGSWLSATVGTWLSATVGMWLSATVGTWLTGTVGTWLSATVGTWLTGTVGTWLSTNRRDHRIRHGRDGRDPPSWEASSPRSATG